MGSEHAEGKKKRPQFHLQALDSSLKKGDCRDGAPSKRFVPRSERHRLTLRRLGSRLLLSVTGAR